MLLWYNWFNPKDYAYDIIFNYFDVYVYDYEILSAKRYAPITMGFEVEQAPEIRNKRICQLKTCHRDGSGPYETSFGVYRYPMAGLKEFLDVVNDDTWIWHNEYNPGSNYLSYASRELGVRLNGCGSHWHFRPNFNELIPIFMSNFEQTSEGYEHLIREIWATTWNNLMELVYYLLPLQMWDYTPRHTALRWATFRYVRYSPNSREFLRLIDRSRCPNPNESLCRDPTSPVDCSTEHECEKHESYDIQAFSWCFSDEYGCNSKPITIEWRLPEVHPSMWATAVIIIINVLRFSFNRGFLSIKTKSIAGIEPKRAFREIYTKIISDRIPWTEVFESYGPVEFYEGRGPYSWNPRLIKFNNMKHVLDTLLNYPLANKGTPYYRVASLIKAGCSPKEQDPNDWWNILAPRGYFRWSNCHVETE